MENKNIKRRWTPEHWAGISPFGIGQQRPNNYKEVFRAAWENRDELAFAWRILSEGVCDGCALGTTGMRDWTLPGPHLCNIRLRLLRLNTMPALDANVLRDCASLKHLDGEELIELGRLPYPMLRRKGGAGFERISWDDAMNRIVRRILESKPDRTAFYLTSRGMPNEAYYAAQKAVRAIGTNNIDNAARVCHSPSTLGLKASVGVAATTCSYTDWMASELIVFIGSNVANNQPVATKYLHYAKKNGAKIVVINPYREPGMERYWIPSIPESALFGTRLADTFFQIDVGGDRAFMNGALKHLVHNEQFDARFIADHTEGFDKLQRALAKMSWEDLERASGASRSEMQRFGQMAGLADRAVFVWSMGITQHTCAVDNVKAIANLALSRGFVGREGCGLMPIRGHSGVQGGAEMGCYSTVFPGGAAITKDNAKALEKQWGFKVPDKVGLTAPEAIDAAHQGKIDALMSVGGNFIDVLPDPDYVREALGRIPLRVHMDIVLSSQMFVEPQDEVILLPAATRYETPGGVTQTSTERRVMFSPEIEGRRIGEARPEIDVFVELARRARPQHKDAFDYSKASSLAQGLREEIARVIPSYAGIQILRRAGDQFQYGGPHLCANGNFPTEDGKAHFHVVENGAAERVLGANEFRLTTRRGKQFNSMVQEKVDALNGAARDSVLMNADDAKRLGLSEGERIELKNDVGCFAGRVAIAPIRAGNLEVHWPEGNVLIDHEHRSPGAGVPDYNAIVRVEATTGDA